MVMMRMRVMITTMMLPTGLLRPGARYSPSSSPKQLRTRVTALGAKRVQLRFPLFGNYEGILVGLFFFPRSIQSPEQVLWAEQTNLNSASYEYKETGE